MTILRLVAAPSDVREYVNLGHRMSASEGESAIRLLEAQGYVEKISSSHGRQRGSACPFHEEPGAVARNKTPNFYINKDNSLYTCMSASCGEKGNLRTLERHFGIDVEDGYVSAIKTKDHELHEFQAALTPERRRPFYEHGLTDDTIDRFRLGYEEAYARYVIPYLEGRRPVFFRYYQPYGEPKYKYTWETGAESRLYNPQDAIGDTNGVVVLTEGEMKAMLLVQMGYAAVAVPGASQWKPEWQGAFTHARKVVILFDNDSTEHHIYDKPEKGTLCQKCQGRGLERCAGHNPGQDAAVKRVEQIGWRARNVVLPLPDGERKTDINEFFMRDNGTIPQLQALISGKAMSTFRVSNFAEISEAPPDETVFLIEQGILPAAGRLLVAGAPKCGKSLLVNNLALSLAAGIPFLERFEVDHATRVLLLDRELSRRSLYDRLSAFMTSRPAYKAGAENLLIDHDHLLRLDMPNAKETLQQLIEVNGAEVCILDTAYKFFAGDVEGSKSLMAAFAVLDAVIAETGVSFVLTHHRKKTQKQGNKQAEDLADPDMVAGSFLWTGWPNATLLLNFMGRSVENPFNTTATFVAFRDAAPPEPLALYRSRESIAYSAIEDYHPSDDYGSKPEAARLSTEAVSTLLLEMCPVTEERFMHVAMARFGCKENAVRPYYLDAVMSGEFVKSGRPTVIKYAYDKDEESWEEEHGLKQRRLV